jgi:hypothetical protein
MAKKSKKTSLLTKTGKTLLGPLNIAQLEEMLEKSVRPKDNAKIQNRIRILKSRKNFIKVVPVVFSQEVVEPAKSI